MSRFIIFIMACITRWALASSLSCNISPKMVGTICQLTPNLSVSQPHCRGLGHLCVLIVDHERNVIRILDTMLTKLGTGQVPHYPRRSRGLAFSRGVRRYDQCDHLRLEYAAQE